MVSRINFFVELPGPGQIDLQALDLKQALDLPHVYFLAFFVFANGYDLILLQAIFPSQVLFEKPRKLFGHSCISFIVSICMGNIMFCFYL